MMKVLQFFRLLCYNNNAFVLVSLIYKNVVARRR